MPAATYLPTTESGLVDFSTNFNARITAVPGAYQLLPGQITGYTALHDAWISAYTAAAQDITRTPVSIIAKNVAKENLINGANGIRALVAIVQANPNTTDEDRGELQITVPDPEPSPVPVPAFPPDLSIVSVLSRTAKLRLKDTASPERRGKPDGVTGATIVYHVGETAPLIASEWAILTQTTRTLVDVEFPDSIAPGLKVWLTAYWYNTKAESSTPAEPVSLRIGDTLAEVA